MPQPEARPAPPEASAHPSGYWQSWWVRVGVGMLIVGAGPLLFIILAAAVGLWPDPNPNPIGPGLLFFFTFWPAVLCILVGVVRVRRARRAAA
jgi:hypothetical protein